MKQNRFRLLGNIFIVLAVIVLFYIYYPLAAVYLFPPKIDSNLSLRGYYIQIPKIHAQAPIILNVNPWNEAEYHEKLKQGVALAKGTSIPGSSGTSFLFAHSSAPPWDLSRYNTVFLRLGELQIGDEILIFKNGQRLKYKVVGKKEVWPNEVSFLKNLSKTQIIIQTCTPIGTDFKRLLIFATPVI